MSLLPHIPPASPTTSGSSVPALATTSSSISPLQLVFLLYNTESKEFVPEVSTESFEIIKDDKNLCCTFRNELGHVVDASCGIKICHDQSSSVLLRSTIATDGDIVLRDLNGRWGVKSWRFPRALRNSRTHPRSAAPTNSMTAPPKLFQSALSQTGSVSAISLSGSLSNSGNSTAPVLHTAINSGPPKIKTRSVTAVPTPTTAASTFSFSASSSSTSSSTFSTPIKATRGYSRSHTEFQGPATANPVVNSTTMDETQTAEDKFGVSSVKNSKLIYWYLPYATRIVFLIGGNANGKSLLLHRYQLELKQKFLFLRPTHPIGKDDVTADRSGIWHKSTPLPAECREILVKMQKESTTRKDEKGKEEQKMSPPDSYDAFCNAFQNLIPGRRWQVSLNCHQVVTFIRHDSQNQSSPYSWAMVSDGLRQLFLLFLRIFHARYSDECPSVIIIDEPETHLHPYLYSKLFLWIFKNFYNADTRIVIATHDFHVIHEISKLFPKESIVMEVTATAPIIKPKVRITPATFKSNDSGLGEKSPMDAPLLCTVHLRCVNPDAFAASKLLNSIPFSETLLRDMSLAPPYVVLCEGFSDDGRTSLDYGLYSALFKDHVEVRAVDDGCSAVRQQVKTMRKSLQLGLYPFEMPVTYFGIIDRDRGIHLLKDQNSESVLVLPVSEVEGLLWFPQIWPVYQPMIQFFKTISDDEFNVRKKQFWSKFNLEIRKKLRFYCLEYYRKDMKHFLEFQISREKAVNGNNDLEVQNAIQIELIDRSKAVANFTQGWTLAMNSIDEESSSMTSPDSSVASPASRIIVAHQQLTKVEDENDNRFKDNYHYLNEKQVSHWVGEIIFAGVKISYQEYEQLPTGTQLLYEVVRFFLRPPPSKVHGEPLRKFEELATALRSAYRSLFSSNLVSKKQQNIFKTLLK